MREEYMEGFNVYCTCGAEVADVNALREYNNLLVARSKWMCGACLVIEWERLTSIATDQQNDS